MKHSDAVELEAFRSLIGLEKRLNEWPSAIPLLEQAIRLYDITKQPSKRETVRKRLEVVDPANPYVKKYFEVEEKKARSSAAIRIGKMKKEEKQVLNQARAFVKETGRCSTSMLQRRMGISYGHAAELVEIIRAELPFKE